MIGCLPTQAFAFLAVFVWLAIAFEWKPGVTRADEAALISVYLVLSHTQLLICCRTKDTGLGASPLCGVTAYFPVFFAGSQLHLYPQS